MCGRRPEAFRSEGWQPGFWLSLPRSASVCRSLPARRPPLRRHLGLDSFSKQFRLLSPRQKESRESANGRSMTSTQNRNETVVQVETVGPIAAGLQPGDESPGFGGESGAAWREEEIFPISWVSPAFPSTGTAPNRRGTGLIRRKIVTCYGRTPGDRLPAWLPEGTQ